MTSSEQQPPHRIVLDPNVVVSAAITPAGAPGRISQLIDAGVLVPVVTEHLVDEVQDVLIRPKLEKVVDEVLRDAEVGAQVLDRHQPVGGLSGERVVCGGRHRESRDYGRDDHGYRPGVRCGADLKMRA
ncbi:MAG: PIN domain-containing protein [Trebonia sp.]